MDSSVRTDSKFSGCDLGLGKRHAELGLNAEHQGDHVRRIQTDVHQLRFRVNVRDDGILLQNVSDDGQNAAPDIGGGCFHIHIDRPSPGPLAHETTRLCDATIADRDRPL